MTPHSAIGETLFCLTYDSEVFIQVEVKKLNWRAAHPLPWEDKNRVIREN